MAYTARSVFVNFPGHGVFCLTDVGPDDSLGLETNSPLAPLAHVDDLGHIKDLATAVSLSYAHLFTGGSIQRLGKPIGHVFDLQPILVDRKQDIPKELIRGSI